MLIIILLWFVINTAYWIKSDEPYNYRVHFLFLPYMFSNKKNFFHYFKSLENKVIDYFNPEYFYQIDFIKRYIIKELSDYCLFDVNVRIKKYKIIISVRTSNLVIKEEISKMEVYIFDIFNKPAEIKIIYEVNL
jgi:hypothetical protein